MHETTARTHARPGDAGERETSDPASADAVPRRPYPGRRQGWSCALRSELPYRTWPMSLPTGVLV